MSGTNTDPPEKSSATAVHNLSAQFMKDLHQLVGVKANPSTAYHPQTDGQTERMKPRSRTIPSFIYQPSPKQTGKIGSPVQNSPSPNDKKSRLLLASPLSSSTMVITLTRAPTRERKSKVNWQSNSLTKCQKYGKKTESRTPPSRRTDEEIL